MMMEVSKPGGGVMGMPGNGGGHPALLGSRYSPSPYRPAADPRRLHNNGTPVYESFEDNLLARAEALAASDIVKSTPSNNLMRSDSLFGHADIPPHNPNMPTRGQMSLSNGFCPVSSGESMLEQLTSSHMHMGGIAPEHGCFGLAAVSHPGHTAQMYPMHSYSSHTAMSMSMSMSNMNNGMASPELLNHEQSQQQQPSQQAQHQQAIQQQQQQSQQQQQHSLATTQSNGSLSPALTHNQQHNDMESDPRELEAFAEHFKQRRIKLGVTQADVGCALGKLKIPGVGSLSQSTICRFESLTLSHNNMIALKPILHTWLEEAEQACRQAAINEAYANADKKRKRTSIAAPEKRSLEAYFAIQPRPSGEKIAQIAEKLDLKKNVVRVWFCNQRQKQKRMKFSATVQGQHSPVPSH